MGKFNIDIVYYPGKTQTQEQNVKMVEEMRTLASSCLDEIPHYQVLTGEVEELERAVIAFARDKNGKLLGFCSALILPVENVGNVFHTGLTCVHPDARGEKLTHKLTSKVLLNYLFKESLFKDTWVTNCACVLSSIGNVALYFEDIYPSPFGIEAPSMTHLHIARDIDTKYREQIAINDSARFNLDSFVFEGSVEGTFWQKDPDDKRFHHRNMKLTNYYKDLLNFESGDEVLQVGKVSLMTFPKYIVKQALKRTKIKLFDFQDKLQTYTN